LLAMAVRSAASTNQKSTAATDATFGELMQDRLITHESKKSWRRSPFAARRAGSYVGYVDYVMYAGYEDFPAPDKL
jgi:hypothetical protein